MKFIKLTRGYIARIDDEDAERVLSRRWHAKVRETSVRITVYAGTNIRREDGPGYRWVSMHRFIMGEPDGEIDHIDGDGLNNTRANLRVCTHAENMRNRRAYGNSQYLGVARGEIRKKTGKVARWRSTIGRLHIGDFKSEIEAAQAYDAVARTMYGEFAKLNFPDHHPDFQSKAAEAIGRA